jgi:hypothetical protein
MRCRVQTPLLGHVRRRSCQVWSVDDEGQSGNVVTELESSSGAIVAHQAQRVVRPAVNIVEL